MAVQLEQGLVKQMVKAGAGGEVIRGKHVTVHCTGVIQNTGQKFWSTKDPGQQPFTFQVGVGSVIKGWDVGVLSMRLGEVAQLRCDGHMAYGQGGFPAWGIGPNEVLIFEIEVLDQK